jgi:polyhydroxyalkanoate synthesis repressor PhaR
MDALLNTSSNGANGSNGNGSLHGGNALEATGRHQSQVQASHGGTGLGNGSGRATGEVIRIRKYPNRRLYDTSRSCHLTHDGVLAVLADGKSVQVTDSRSGADITNAVLLQILIERDPAKVAAVPSALIHRAMRSDAAALRAAAEAALVHWTQTSGTASAPATPAPASTPAMRPVAPAPHPNGTAQRAHFPLNGNGHSNGTSNGHATTEPTRGATSSVVDNGRPKAKAKRVDG